MNFSSIIIILFLIATETTALYFIQGAADKSSHKYLLLGILIYIFVPILYFMLLKMGDEVGLANVAFNTGTNISVLFMGYLFYNQRLTKQQLIGVIAIILGTLLLK
jgi:uncharacterized membrane protein